MVCVLASYVNSNYLHLHTVNDCGQDPAMPVNGNVLTSGTTFGSRAIYFCDVGYDLYPTSDYERICIANETWSGFDPTCERKFITGYILLNGIKVEVMIVPINAPFYTK